ncbi:sortase domain-bontaining protein [Arthrobacter sp. NPDC057388]|uniref:class F sortase n=1 Tax=Arthrobacter sp. NPDC057388 TaxID=3346116 RepID=UPI00363C0A97
MGSHRRNSKTERAGSRRLLLSYVDLLVLSFCCLGILTAWLFYGAGGISSSSATAVDAPAVRYTPAGPVTGRPEADARVRAGQSPAASIGVPAKSAAPRPSAASKPPAITASPPQRIIYPAAGMDVAVHPLEPGSGDADSRSIVPPETMDGYWLTPYGQPGVGSLNTTYVIGHSWEGQDAPFNHLSAAAVPGDVLTVVTAKAKLSYRVNSVTTYTKSTFKDSPIWSVVPNRLVLVSCYTQDLWGKNVAVVASPVPAN